MQHDDGTGLRESVRRRLQFIEFRLYWEGRINRKDLIEKFDTSEQQASADLARYKDLAPGRIEYDKSLKAYITLGEFKPVFFEPSARQYLSQLRSIDDEIVDIRETWIGHPPSHDVVPFLRRRTSWETLKPISDAIRKNRAIEICYRSMSTPEPHWRWIGPHSLVFDGHRWHVRAWCFRHSDFRDFAVPRIDATRETKDSDIDPQMDLAWHRKLRMRISPNPFLSEAQKELISVEYGMDDGFTEIETRASLAFYVKAHLHLDEKPSKENCFRIHLHLENSDEIDEFERKAKEDSMLLNKIDSK